MTIFVCGGTFHVASNAAAAPPVRHARVTKVEVMQIAKGLTNPSAAVRIATLKQLGALGPAAKPAVPSIINTLNENRSGIIGGNFAMRYSPEITTTVIETLGQIGPGAIDASPYLVQLLDDQNELFRRDKVLTALERIGLDDSATKTIMRVVNQEGKFTQTRNTAIRLLGKIDPPAIDAVELLNTVAADEKDAQARQEALAAIASIQKRADARDRKNEQSTESAERTALRVALESKEKDARIDALHKIADMGAPASNMVPRLMQLVNERDPEINHAAVVALGAIGPDASTALPVLIARLFAEKDEDERRTIARAVSSIDPDGKRVIPMLQPTFEDPFKARISILMLEELGTETSAALAQKTRLRWHIK